MKKKLAILGSTGSVGEQVLEVVRASPDVFDVVALATYRNTDRLLQQIIEFSPQVVSIGDPDALTHFSPPCDVVSGIDGLVALAEHHEIDLVVVAVGGFSVFPAVLAAIRAKKMLALANKEVLVGAGPLLLREAEAYGVSVIPLDSEHSAIFQCLQGQDAREISRLVITASGGPFYRWSIEDLQHVTLRDALRHPTWKMGTKITVDCSTLMNKGLEVIEAVYLFGIAIDQVEVVVHPQSCVHSFVEFSDGSMLAQVSEPDMRLPIHYALHYPNRVARRHTPFDFYRHGRFDFYPVDNTRFPCIDLALDAIKTGGTLPCFMNAANEVLVERFSAGDIQWTMIGEKLTLLMMQHRAGGGSSFEELLEVDNAARSAAALI